MPAKFESELARHAIQAIWRLRRGTSYRFTVNINHQSGTVYTDKIWAGPRCVLIAHRDPAVLQRVQEILALNDVYVSHEVAEKRLVITTR